MKKHFETNPLPKPLTPREHQVLQLAAAGHSTKEIAEKLKLQAPTVETHKVNLYRKLHARNITHAVSIAVKQGLI